MFDTILKIISYVLLIVGFVLMIINKKRGN